VAITHATVKASGERGYVSEWNADHVVTDESKPKNFTTLIVAASNSLDKTRADYVCDGVDDDVEINAALNALPVQGGRVSLLEGTYNITSSIVVAKSSTSIEGLGYATIIQTESNIDMIYVLSKNYVVIKNLRIAGSWNELAQNGIYIKWSDNFVIDSVIIAWTGKNGIEVYNCYDSMINNCIIEDVRNDGIHFSVACVHHVITNNLIIYPNAKGIYINSMTYSIISNNLIDSGEYGIYIYTSLNYSLVMSNLTVANSNDGLYMNNCSSNSISNNYSQGNGNDALKFNGACNYNIISNSQLFGNLNNGITIPDTCSQFIVVGNNCTDNGNTGISDLGVGTEIAHNKT